MNRKKKEKKNLWQKGKFSFITKKKKTTTTNIFFQKNKRLLYIDTFFFWEKKGKVFTLNSNTYYLIYNFFLTSCKNIFGKLV